MWEGLRSGAATLRAHQTDAGGSSWASEFGAVAVNDLFEWRKADDCWVRYRVMGAPVHPSDASGRWEFPIEWMTYAASGAGCTGAVGPGAVLRVDEAAPDVIVATAITSPVRHGAFLLVPEGWGEKVEAATRHESPDAEGAVGASDPVPEGWTESLAEARRFRTGVTRYCRQDGHSRARIRERRMLLSAGTAPFTSTPMDTLAYVLTCTTWYTARSINGRLS